MAFDVITIGGGLGGSSLAWALAKQGLKVLVIERERQFKDRVRGEGILPWGVNEARDLGVYDILANSCGRIVNYWTSHAWANRPPRDLVKTTPRGSHCINFYHPTMQETMIEAAESAGATVRRGVRVTGVETGKSPKVILSTDGKTETIGARLLVAADGRASMTRKWVGFQIQHDPERMMVAGTLLEGVDASDSSNHVFRNSSAGEGALLFPLGSGRVRTYFLYRKQGERRGLSGEKKLSEFLEACCRVGVSDEWIKDAKSAGPLAEFDGADTWVPHPHREGVVLLGDAAGCNDPSWGNGLSLTLRDARVLRDCLLEDDNWEQAADAYAKARDEHFGVINRVTGWLTHLLYEVGPEADARRDRAFALMKEDRSRNPDYIAHGPNSPSDEKARRRMFGEE